LALHLPSSTNILRNCNLRVQIPLLWQDCLVEKPTRSFIKTLLTWQTAARWRISSAIMAIEPDLNQTNYDW
ncbi:14658_t:CDS:1, partial [Gigaspora rosea]